MKPQVPPSGTAARPGVVEWFHVGDHERVEWVIERLKAIQVTRLRTGCSWAEWHVDGGAAWYGWLLPRLARDFELLPCFCYTPPSLARAPRSSAPPRRPRDFADFLDHVVDELGSTFEWIELWNEPNNLNDWDWRLDPDWLVFCEMIGAAAYWMRQRGKRTVLGGMCPTDANWLSLMCRRGVIAYIDAVGLHGFPGTWDHHWTGWAEPIEAVRTVLAEAGQHPELWLTEVGHSTWRHGEAEQLACLVEAAAAPVDRVYLYAATDLDPTRPSQEGFHVDERHYHFGLMGHDGRPKLAYRLLQQGGMTAVETVNETVRQAPGLVRPRTLITGGAGFIGSNIADRLASDGEPVLIFDSLSRAGVEENLFWLRRRHGSRIAFHCGDIRDEHCVRDAVRVASQIFHLAAQVAVTTSVLDPVVDFEVNARGTLNVLEAARRQPVPPPLVFASTNKVYGKLGDLALEEAANRYQPVDTAVRAYGVGESWPLDLYSPYGCSKGAADQYVLDYVRIYDLPAVVLRMSCIFGPRQFGTEDQGWVAHFLISMLDGRPITIYGDGKQVRDILYVDDVVAAFLLAQRHMGTIRGRAFNIGGGPANAVSLRELLTLAGRLTGEPPVLNFSDWRPGDQAYYVSDTRRFAAATGWQPAVTAEDGVGRLLQWLQHQAAEPAALPLREGVMA